MKKLFISLLGIAMLIGFVHAQNNTMYLMKSGNVAYKRAVTEIDSVLLHKPARAAASELRTITVDMARLSGPASAHWYNPTNGKFTEIAGSPLASSGSRAFATPGDNGTGTNDWVLVLERDADRIRLYPKNPFYWQYRGKPVLLLGGSSNDCLFQGVSDPSEPFNVDFNPLEKLVLVGQGVHEELDLLRSIGGNYVRNTMSDRKGVRAFRQLADGKYDLNQWNDVYWQRFNDFLRWAEEREIIVGIETWDPHDHVRMNWTPNPWNPDMNVNYTAAESALANDYPDGASANKQPFFYTVPALNNNTVVLPFQQKFVDKMLSYTLRRGNVLYLMDNEFTGSPEWSKYWAKHIRAKASAAGKAVYLTEMWRDPELSGSQHRNVLDYPGVYDFCDVSQNTVTGSLGDIHWTRMQWVRQYLLDHKRPWPINTTKIYASDESGPNWYGGVTSDAVAKFFMQIIGGQAATRFHRPGVGIGLNAEAQAAIKSGRLLTDAMNIFVCGPRNDLLSERSQNEAYCTAEPGRQYAVYFPDGGAVKLDASAAKGTLEVRWLDIARSAWQEPQRASGGSKLEIWRHPGRGTGWRWSSRTTKTSKRNHPCDKG